MVLIHEQHSKLTRQIIQLSPLYLFMTNPIKLMHQGESHYCIVHNASQNPYLHMHKVQSPHGNQLQKTWGHEEPER